MKKTTQIIVSVLTFFSVLGAGMPLIGQTLAPLPDNNTRVTIPPIVTSEQAQPTANSQMLVPVEVEPTADQSPSSTQNLPPIVRGSSAAQAIGQAAPNSVRRSVVPPVIVPSAKSTQNPLVPLEVTGPAESAAASQAPETSSTPSPSGKATAKNTSAPKTIPSHMKPVETDALAQSRRSRTAGTTDTTPDADPIETVDESMNSDVVLAGNEGLAPGNIRTADPVPPVVTSSAGVPLYPPGTRSSELPFAASPESTESESSPSNRSETTVRRQPSAFARSDANGDLPYYANSDANSSRPWYQDLPSETPDAPIEIQPPPTNGTSDMLNDSTAGNNDYFDPETVMEVGSGCGNPSCAGCYGLDEGAIQNQMGCCGFMTCTRRYVKVDALYITRNDAGIQGSNFFGVGGSSYGWGIRATIGHRYDSANGVELSYMGTTDLADSETFNDPLLARLDANWIVAGGFTGVESTGFFNAVTQTQNTESMLHSLEWNRTQWAWDVYKSFYGLRYIYFDNDYDFFSQNSGGTQGLLQMDATNHLIGGHIGSELFYDVGYRLSYSLYSKAGAYLNASKFETRLYNGGTQFLNNESSDGQLAASFDLGFQGHYQLKPRLRLRFGYNLLWLWGVVTSDNNFPTVLHPGTGRDPRSTSIDGELIHGANFGLEFYR